MLISPKHKFIFFKPMKCAGSSIEASLYEHCTKDAICTGGVNLQKTGWEYIPQNNGDRDTTFFHGHTWPELLWQRFKRSDFSDYKKITVVRNPWDQLVSYYWWNHQAIKEQFPSLAINEDDSRAKVQSKFYSYISKDMWSKGYKNKSEYIWGSPLGFISSINESFIVDDITDYLVFENLNDQFTKLCSEIGITDPFLKKLKSHHRNAADHYSDYYNPDAAELVATYYKKTIEAFNYKFEGANR